MAPDAASGAAAEGDGGRPDAGAVATLTFDEALAELERTVAELEAAVRELE